MKHRSFGAQGARCFPFPVVPHTFLTANEKDFSLSLEMTNAGEQYSHIVILLHGEPVKRPSPSFPWKEGEGAEIGSRRGIKGNMGKAVSRIVIPSGVEGSFSFAVFFFPA